MAALERKKIDVYQRIKEDFLIPLFSSSDVEVAKKVLNAVVDGGSGIIEMTHREAGSYEVFKKVASDNTFKDVLLGTGSVIDEPTAAMYIDAGASFIVGPNFNSRIMRLCNRINLLYIPGCGSLNEIIAAYEEGAVVVKLFPAGEMGGPKFLKSISAPCPWIEAIPTGGVEPTEENLKGWIDAGAVAVGMGSKLIQKGFIKAQQWDKIKGLVSDTLKIISSIKNF
jgi:2-dehydro-3-deoxyphosphogluconate aldolase / (4S)-4-hydroxy-2-oxoglutarate aldolase